MAPATFSNSAGPGSATELSPVTIAVRDKIIEKFADLPLEDMNESVKRLLSQEKDEQKRLGILAARVFILRQRIVKLAEAEPERVIGSKSPDVDDALEANGDLDVGDEVSSEWTRLRILEDCEVNGVRFPRTVIVDVKSADAELLVANGKAELVDEAPSTTDTPAVADAEESTATEAAGSDSTQPVTATGNGAETDSSPEVSKADMNALADALSSSGSTKPAVEASPETAVDSEPQQEVATTGSSSQEQIDGNAAENEAAETEAVIEAPSAAEVTAALEALSSNGAESAAEAAAEPEPLSSDEDQEEGEAAEVAAALEAAAAAMGGPAVEEDEAPPTKSGGWLEAQQNAEQQVENKDD